MELSTGAVVSVLILAGCAAAIIYVWFRSSRWMREDHSRPAETPEDREDEGAARDADHPTDPRDKPDAGL